MGYDRDLEFLYYCPTKVVFSENSLKEIGLEVDALRCSRAMIITDSGVVEAGLAEKVIAALGHRYIATYDGCVQDSGLHIVAEGAAIALEKGADILISVGGGSVIDTAKGIAIVMKEGGKLEDYLGLQSLSRPQTPHIVVPTTAGTGSEVTMAMVIKDHDRNTKLQFGDFFIIPNTAILDPTLTVGLPPMLTASTGMDAFTHAVESFVSQQRQPILDALALHAIRLIVEYLPRCVEQGDDLVARGQQQIAATLAGIAFGLAQTGLTHSMAHSIGALFGVPHGIGNSLLLPHVILFNMEECADRYALVAAAMGAETKNLSDLEAGKAAAEHVWKLTKKIGLTQKLSELKIPESGLEEAAELSLEDTQIVNNPRIVFEAEEILEVYRSAW